MLPSNHPSIILTNSTPSGRPLQATYLLNKGYQLASYSQEGIEVLDQHFPLPKLLAKHLSTQSDCLGKPALQEVDLEEQKWWKWDSTSTQLEGRIKQANDLSIRYYNQLLPSGLFTSYSIASKTPSLIGLEYHYQLPSSLAAITGEVLPIYRHRNTWNLLPPHWIVGKHFSLYLPIQGEIDYTFLPKKWEENTDTFRILLKSETHEVHIHFHTLSNGEFCYHIAHRPSFPYVSMTLFSARKIEAPKLCTNSIQVKTQIFPIEKSSYREK